MLDHLGIEQDFGCRALGTVPQRFSDDAEVLRAFKTFQTACVLSLKLAERERDEKAEAGAAAAADGLGKAKIAE